MNHVMAAPRQPRAHWVWRWAFVAVLLAGSFVFVDGAATVTPPPSRVDVVFAGLPHGWVKGIPRDVRADSRIVGIVGGRRLAVAPTRNGNFCEAFDRGFAGCRVRSAGAIGPTTMGGGKEGLTTIAGDVLTTSRTSRLYLKVAGRPERIVPMIWVSPPIAAGFFWMRVPPTKKPARLVLREGSTTISTFEIEQAPVGR